MQAEAPRLAARLEECGADATSLWWPPNLRDDRWEHQIMIPAPIADFLLAMTLSLIPRPQGRPAKISTQAARILAGTHSQREAARTIALETGEDPEAIRKLLVNRKKKRPRKPRK